MGGKHSSSGSHGWQSKSAQQIAMHTQDLHRQDSCSLLGSCPLQANCWEGSNIQPDCCSSSGISVPTHPQRLAVALVAGRAEACSADTAAVAVNVQQNSRFLPGCCLSVGMCYARLWSVLHGRHATSTLRLQVFNAYRVQHNDFRGEPRPHSVKLQGQSPSLKMLETCCAGDAHPLVHHLVSCNRALQGWLPPGARC